MAMNERIKLLAKQAGFYKYGDDFEDIIEKFAELIVRECLNEIESQRSNGENDDQWTITRDLCYHNMMAQLKQHFGVKE
jgi:hypothetical protein